MKKKPAKKADISAAPKAESRTLPSYDSIAQCAAETGIPASVIKQARRLTREPFKGHRIALGPLLKAIFEQRGEQDWKALREKWMALREQMAGERERGLSMDGAEVGKAITRAMGAFWSEWERLIQIDLPPDLKGCDEERIRQRLADTTEKFKVSLKAAWGKMIAKGEKANEDAH